MADPQVFDLAEAGRFVRELQGLQQYMASLTSTCDTVEELIETTHRNVTLANTTSCDNFKTTETNICEALRQRMAYLETLCTDNVEKNKSDFRSMKELVENHKKIGSDAGSELQSLLLNRDATLEDLGRANITRLNRLIVESKTNLVRCEHQLKTTVSAGLSHFVGTYETAALNAIGKIGIMTNVVSCPEKCTVQPKPETLQLKESDHPITFKVITCDSKGIACGRGGDKIEAYLKSTADPLAVLPPTIEAKVVDNNDGTYSVPFVPEMQRPGPYLLTIKVNGSNIKGSPFQVTLRRPSLQRKLSKSIETINHYTSTINFPQEIACGRLYGIAVAQKGTIFVSDYSNRKIHVFNKQKKHMTSFGTQGHGKGGLLGPCGLSVDSNESMVYVADLLNTRVSVLEFSRTGKLKASSEFGQQTTRSPRQPQNVQQPQNVRHPVNVTIHNKQIYIVDQYYHRVFVYTLLGDYVGQIGRSGSGPGEFDCPTAVAFSPTNGHMYVVDSKNDRVQVFYANGQYKTEFGQGQLKNPGDMVITSDEEVLVADRNHNRVAVFSTCGNCGANNFIHSFAVRCPQGLAIDNDGNILVTELSNCRSRSRVVVF